LKPSNFELKDGSSSGSKIKNLGPLRKSKDWPRRRRRLNARKNWLMLRTIPIKKNSLSKRPSSRVRNRSGKRRKRKNSMRSSSQILT